MHLTRLKWALTFALAVLVTGAGAAALLPRAFAAADDTEKVARETKKLQGTWVCEFFEREGRIDEKAADGRLTIDGENFVIVHDDRVETRGKIKLHPSNDPMMIDLQIEEGNEAGKAILAIYAWDGEKLKLCAADPRSGIRPTEFTTMADDSRILIICKRQSL